MHGEDRYGYFKYGESAPGFPDRITPRKGPDVESGPTPEEALGTGVALKPTVAPGIEWDFEVDSSGDLGTTKGYDELGKDVAFYTAWEGYEQLIGELRTARSLDSLESTIESIASNDDRVDEAVIVDVEKAHDPDRVNVRLHLDADTDNYNVLVFPLTVSG